MSTEWHLILQTMSWVFTRQRRFSVKFENETFVGSGPVREYFSLLMSMLIQGFLLDGEKKSPTLIF